MEPTSSFLLTLVPLYVHAFGLNEPDKAPGAENRFKEVFLKIVWEQKKMLHGPQTLWCVCAYLQNSSTFWHSNSHFVTVCDCSQISL